MGQGAVELFLQGAVGIKNTEIFADPYAVITCWRQSFRSVTAKKQGSNPVWNQKFVIQVEDGITEIFVKIYDQDRFTGDDFIGSVKIPLARVFEERNLPLSSYDVILPSGKVKGQLKASLTFAPSPPQVQSSSGFAQQEDQVKRMGT